MTAFFLVVIALLLVYGYYSGSNAGVMAASMTTDNGTPAPTYSPEGGTGYQSDGSLTGAPITQDPGTWPGSVPGYSNGNVWNIAAAVALAEGYNDGPGTAPYDLNNPGDLSPGDEAGQAVAGPPQFHGGSNIIFFQTVEGGFIALYTKFFNIVTGNSKVYPKTYTWTQVAAKYAGDSANWLNNVTNYLGVDPSSTPAQYAGT